MSDFKDLNESDYIHVARQNAFVCGYLQDKDGAKIAFDPQYVSNDEARKSAEMLGRSNPTNISLRRAVTADDIRVAMHTKTPRLHSGPPGLMASDLCDAEATAARLNEIVKLDDTPGFWELEDIANDGGGGEHIVTRILQRLGLEGAPR